MLKELELMDKAASSIFNGPPDILSPRITLVDACGLIHGLPMEDQIR
jgi:hypothetical protein